MEIKSKVAIYGDSIMRGTVIDGELRYHSTISQWLKGLAARFDICFNNRAHFGITVEKGLALLKRDVENGLESDYALLEFGGNDCSFLWNEVSAAPSSQHYPATGLDRFKEALQEMVALLRQVGATPVLMTLPPIDAKRYLNFISRNGNSKENIEMWLGDIQLIYRFHELYSAAIAHVAEVTSSVLVDVRSRFLPRHDLPQLIGEDGIHPSAGGYGIICESFADFIEANRAESPRGG